ncbi:LysR family transcriptional regulator [Vibrio sp. 10N.261.55.A7]|uniref:LysR family transcriptional regulator n=1 Tax=Vibrio TaxID=662 RepID=UPI000C863372|nr:LysR family transcriptional regulator [Vibrio sp. 10N.261.55.A7]PMK03672.1 hypothetical protein BCU12_16705 [Vibrio sp. 10N.261.55.A7]
MSYSIEQVQAFVATVENKGIAQAARALGKHVSTVREQVNNFEIDTGLILFERLPRSIEVTPQGWQLYKYAQSMLNESNHFEAKIDSLHKGVPDSLTVAIDTSLIDKNVDLLLADILEKYPYLNLKVLNGDTMQVRDWVINNRADVGLAFSSMLIEKKVTVTQAYSFKVVRVAPIEWKMPANSTERNFSDRLQLTYSFLAQVGLRDADIISHRHMMCNNAIQMLNLIKTGVGWGHLPHFICREAIENTHLTLFEDKFPDWSAEVIILQEAHVNPTMQMFIDGVCQLGRRD